MRGSEAADADGNLTPMVNLGGVNEMQVAALVSRFASTRALGAFSPWSMTLDASSRWT